MLQKDLSKWYFLESILSNMILCNIRLLENVELKGFKNESEFIKVGKNISEIEKKKKIEYENLKTAI